MTDFEQRYVTARKAVIARDLARLNPMQRQGAMTTEGPLLLLAGAGSGKTTVLIQRVYNLLTYGRGSDSDEVPDWATEEDLAFLEQFPDRPDGDEVRRVHRLCAVDAPRPWEIIAITFTNKAAGELKERLAARLGPAANDVWASTFHSACVRILRRDIDRIGFDKDFTIYDTDDAKRVIKDILKEQNLDEKTFPVRSVLSAISASKDRYEGPEVFRKKAEAANDWKNTRIAKIYAAYQQKLSTANALDFDDIIYHTVTLLQTEPEVLDYYQKKFRYVLVDEYQDTNHLQYLLTGLLAGGHRNLCVVGDDDQSIYRFRGANIENILNFEKQYKDALKAAPSMDMALFGRMVADDPSLNYDAAAQVAHSISTHAVKNEYDYFTAVDDCPAEDNAGAGHLGTVEYNSSTLYRYATVNVMELAGQLGAEQAAETVRAFGEAFLFSMPTGKQNTFANRTLPDAVYVTLREDQPVNLCGAFERAVPRSAQGYAAPSKAALAQYAQQMYSSFAEAPAQSFTVGGGLQALAPAQTAKAMLDALEKAVRDALAGNEVG